MLALWFNVVCAPVQDRPCGVVLGVQRAHRHDRARQVGERLEKFADGGDLVALGVDGDLAEDGADAVGQRRDQVRGLPVLAQAGEHVGPGVGGPLADRGERPRPGGQRESAKIA